MKVRLLRPARINHNAGEVLEISPAQAAFLLSVGSAEVVRTEKRETPEKPAKTTTRKK